jgi:hypothetical protein
MSKLSNVLKSINEWLPYIIKDEMDKRDVQRRLEAQLKEYLAWGQEQRKTQEAGTAEQIIQNLFHPEYFKERNLPEATILSWLEKTYPQLIQQKGIHVPEDINQQLDKVNEAVTRMTIAREAGEPQQEEVIRTISKFMGEKPLGEAATEYVKGKEAAKERPIREREVTVQEKLVPIREKETAARLKELEGEIGDMTAKEARTELSDLGVERRRYQAQLQTKTNQLGELLSEEEINYIKSNIAEIKKLEDEISSKHGKTIDAEYKAVADGLRAKGYTAADLDTNEQIRSALIERGYNINALKKYMR